MSVGSGEVGCAETPSHVIAEGGRLRKVKGDSGIVEQWERVKLSLRW